ncbi:rod shape-determining protein MreD [Salimicrobium halophilum]|uniref:Rod shape-determining protein MreD n=1 Tax=Salimicrobium halophilum TaxID=86666 RepID=A0A1G8PLJ6_9BACI|nr:rod shape-determining protein MreD [Salimicrobium halophilum]SDI92720.1 rod shape-determining protein MreD [Salimicrobium halophilum]
MKHVWLCLLALLLIALEGMAMNLLPSSLLYGEWQIVPHWTLLFVLLLSIYYDSNETYQSLWYALGTGLFVDIVYTDVIGIHMMVYVLVVYIVHGLNKLLQSNVLVVTLLVLFGVVTGDTLLYIIYSFLNIAEMDWGTYAMQRLLPTMIGNVVFFLFTFVFLKYLMQKLADDN